MEAYQYQRADRMEIQAAIQEKRARSLAAGGTGTSNYAKNLYMLKLKNDLTNNTASQQQNGAKGFSSGDPSCIDVNGNGPVPYLRR